MHELILGGAKSGKSRCAETRALDWLRSPGRAALLLATALPGDAEMRARIERHRAQRAAHVPALEVREVPIDLAPALRRWAAPERLLVVDCLSLWLTQHLMPLNGEPPGERQASALLAELCAALGEAPGPVVLVSNEIGMGVVPLGRDVRRYLDTLGALHQQVAHLCQRVTLMVAGLEMRVKG